MSASTGIVYGFGFNITCDDELLINFIINHKETFCKSEEEICLFNNMLEYTSKQYDLEDFFEQYACNSSGMEGNGAVISNIMSRETGIRFEYQSGDSGCDSYPTILFSESMPWHYNDKEKKLTEESLKEICEQYAIELGIDIDDINMCKIEYYG